MKALKGKMKQHDCGEDSGEVDYPKMGPRKEAWVVNVRRLTNCSGM
jgi:hypothetical protein